MNSSRTIDKLCYGLMGTAIFLAGVLAVTLVQGDRTDAEARMVSSQNHLTFLTARTREDEDSLFVLNNHTGLLVIYRVDARNEIRLAGQFDVQHFFGPGQR